MKQVFHHYEKWEDWQNGMFEASSLDVLRRHVELAKELLCDSHQLDIYMRMACEDWICSAEQNLTDRSRNRRAWLGQAACCIAYGVPESSTKMAWWKLTPEQRCAANSVAETVITDWEKEYERCQSGQSVLTF